MFNRILTHTLELCLHCIYPPICLNCRQSIREPHALCPNCWSQLSFIEPPFCEILGLPFAYDLGETCSLQALMAPPFFKKARSVVRYSGIARSLVHHLKYGDRLETASLLGRMMWYSGRDLLKKSDLIVPVPLHRWRLWKRRFNQAALLASKISQLSGIPWHGTLCIRRKNTPSQVGLKRAQREKNLRDAFSVPSTYSQRLHGKHVLIIDDVFTTGASVNSLSKTLLDGGAASVNVLTFARVIINDEAHM